MSEQIVDEAKQLRTCINDLIGIVALPAIWSGELSNGKRSHSSRHADRHAPTGFRLFAAEPFSCRITA